MSSPASDNNMSNADFGDRLKTLAKQHKQIMKLAAAVYSLPKGKSLHYSAKEQIGRRELNGLSSQFTSELKSLKKAYTAHGKRQRKKRDPSKGGSAGFKNPIIVSEAMQRFLAGGNFGPSDPFNTNSAPLNSLLSGGANRVTTRGIMTPLLSIYSQLNNMQQDPNNKQFLTATPEMKQVFGATFGKLEAEPARVGKKSGKPLPRFNRDKFQYARLQSIVSDNVVPLTDEQKKELEQQRPRLEQEQTLVSEALEKHTYLAEQRAGKTTEPFESWVVEHRRKKKKN